MVLMAKEMIDKKVILGFIIPKEFKYFKDKLAHVKQGGNFMILGGGDVVFPCLLAASAMLEMRPRRDEAGMAGWPSGSEF